MTTARRRYPTDLTDAEWQLLAPLIPAPKPGGRPPLHDRRELINAMAYWLRAGCAWRLLPPDLPPWQTVYHYFRSWRQQGLWEQVHATLRVQERVRQGATTHPRARRSWTAKEPEADSKIDGEWQAAAPGGASAEPGRIGEVRVWGWTRLGSAMRPGWQVGG